jgi:hypothetical protein
LSQANRSVLDALIVMVATKKPKFKRKFLSGGQGCGQGTTRVEKRWLNSRGPKLGSQSWSLLSTFLIQYSHPNQKVPILFIVIVIL